MRCNIKFRQRKTKISFENVTFYFQRYLIFNKLFLVRLIPHEYQNNQYVKKKLNYSTAKTIPQLISSIRSSHPVSPTVHHKSTLFLPAQKGKKVSHTAKTIESRRADRTPAQKPRLFAEIPGTSKENESTRACVAHSLVAALS